MNLQAPCGCEFNRCEPPGLLQESLGAIRARSVPESVPENRGCPRVPECPTGCLRGPSGSGLRSVHKVPRERPGVSKRCHSRDTFGYLEPVARRAPETPRRTLPRTPPIFGDTPWTLRARRARETAVTGRGVRNSIAVEDVFENFWLCSAFATEQGSALRQGS